MLTETRAMANSCTGNQTGISCPVGALFLFLTQFVLSNSDSVDLQFALLYNGSVNFSASLLMSDLFISYARLDIDYRLLLVDQLLVVVKTGPIGRISPTADWLSESYRGIRAADYFLFVTVLFQ